MSSSCHFFIVKQKLPRLPPNVSLEEIEFEPSVDPSGPPYNRIEGMTASFLLLLTNSV